MFHDTAEKDSRKRWAVAWLAIVAVFCLGMAGLGTAGFGPCAISSPIALMFSASISSAALFCSLNVLSARQRRFRLRTIPFYVVVVLGMTFIGVQLLLFFVSL